MFIISAEFNGSKKYLTIDSNSGYPYWGMLLFNAKLFITKKEVEDAFNGNDFKLPSLYNLASKLEKGTFIQIEEITTTLVKSKDL